MIYRILAVVAISLILVVVLHAQETQPKLTPIPNSPFSLMERPIQVMCTSSENMEAFLKGNEFELVGTGTSGELQFKKAPKYVFISKTEKTMLSLIILGSSACIVDLNEQFKLNEGWVSKLLGAKI